MESINGLLRHLAGTKERASDHQVRAWIKQVMELAYDSNNCVERYAQTRSGGPRRRKGFLGRLHRATVLPWAMVVRRRVATQIQQLKVRAHEVGERQQRYGVVVLPKTYSGVVIPSMRPPPPPSRA
ncbi:disease resistance protein Pik-2-like [Oryza brachyantha]|uniref:disease resistance protein Pik-2-like n=1 Tax=Oryza brachyantha TaxID=4533 RepID=UPI001ADCCEB5|nr:disease resistance protein Pik-2-like [Oryza brachyantha]